jgi:dTDP-glucose 4,6-dehydratase
MIYCFDIDGTICDSKDGYHKAKPYPEIIDFINELYYKGHTIKIYTARGKATNMNWELFTLEQLFRWGVNYHEITFNKPAADIYIDDKAVNARDFNKGA